MKREMMLVAAMLLSGCAGIQAGIDKGCFFSDGYKEGCVYASGVGMQGGSSAMNSTQLALWKLDAKQACEGDVPWMKVSSDEYIAACNVTDPTKAACTIRSGRSCRVVSIYSKDEARYVRSSSNESLLEHEEHHYRDGFVHP